MSSVISSERVQLITTSTRLGRIPSHDLRVIKARLAWVNDRYTRSERFWLQVLAQSGGNYFKHPTSVRACLRFLESDGYIVTVKARESLDDRQAMDTWRLTEIGRWFAKAWKESGAHPLGFRTGQSPSQEA